MLVVVTMSRVGNFAAIHAFPSLVWLLYVDAAIGNRRPLPPRHKLLHHDATEQATTARVRATMATMGMLTPTASHGRVHPGDQSQALPQWSAGTHRRRRGLATASGLTDKFANVSVSSNKPMLETPNDERSDNISRDL